MAGLGLVAPEPLDFRAAADAIPWEVRPFINGRFRDSESTSSFDNVDPSTENPLCSIAVGAAADVDEAVRIARRRFEEGSWSEEPAARRLEVLSRLADLMVENGPELALLDCLEMGKPIRAALDDATQFAPALLRSWAGFTDKLVGVSAPVTMGTLSFNTFEPRGVVGAITPWNFPCVNAVYKLGPALAAGNSVVLKPSEVAPSSALRIAQLAHEAGVPEGVLNVVPGLGSTVGEALALHPDVDLLSFTGSTATGRKIMQLAGRSNGKPVLLECGGKSPQVVFDDADDLESVARATVESVLWNQGQVCSAHTRLLVQSSIKQAILDKVVSRMSQCSPGRPLDWSTTFGPLASPNQRDRVKSFIEQGLAAGAEAVLLGSIQETGGCYVAPTVFDRATESMSIVQEEIFGPVLCVQSFETEEEAAALANATMYGLAATVWTRDIGRGRRMAHRIRAGGVTIRTSGAEEGGWGLLLGSEPQKASGFGSELGLRGLESYSTLKSVQFRGS